MHINGHPLEDIKEVIGMIPFFGTLHKYFLFSKSSLAGNLIVSKFWIIDSLSNLQDLDIYFCSIKRYSYDFSKTAMIPESIGSLTFLKKLNLKRNELKEIPSSIKNLTKLKELDLSHNKFEEIPHIIINLKRLENLNIKHNNIQDIPDTFKVFLNSLENFNF